MHCPCGGAPQQRRPCTPALANASSLSTDRTRNARAPTSPRNTGLGAIWDCISSSPSSRRPLTPQHALIGFTPAPLALCVHATNRKGMQQPNTPFVRAPTPCALVPSPVRVPVPCVPHEVAAVSPTKTRGGATVEDSRSKCTQQARATSPPG